MSCRAIWCSRAIRAAQIRPFCVSIRDEVNQPAGRYLFGVGGVKAALCLERKQRLSEMEIPGRFVKVMRPTRVQRLERAGTRG